ncbi:MAG: alpha/beta fold hydrolase [Clostridia bacterium]|nr:alpha/beta fold hydrolase [Clostridia bacterium]
MNTRPVRDFSNPACQPFHLQGDSHGVLLLHGFTGSAGHMRLLGEGLHARGFTVEGINLPGHAVSMEEMGQTGWQDWLDAAKEAFLALKSRCRFVSVAGLSMGGCIALILAEQMHPTAIAPISAPMAVRNRLLPLAGLAAPFVPRVMWRSREGASAQVDDRYDYGYPGFPTKCGADLNRLIRMARRDLHAVQCPMLVVQSRQDETISADSADVILAGAGSTKKGILWLDDVPHVCTISKEHANIAGAVADLFRQAEHS